MGCMVIPGLFGILVQFVLFLVCVSALLVKWAVETRNDRKKGETPRPFWTFCLDGSKQLAGAAWLHITNLAFATVLATFVGKGDECEWYWINIMIDTTLGCAVSFCMLKLVNAAIKQFMGPELSKEWVTSGHYYVDGHFKWSMFLKQAFIWVVVVVTCMKMVMVCIMITFHVSFLNIASSALEPFLNDDRLKLLVVMILTPGIMNAFQFCVVDNIIKLNKKLHGGLLQPLAPNNAM